LYNIYVLNREFGSDTSGWRLTEPAGPIEAHKDEQKPALVDGVPVDGASLIEAPEQESQAQEPTPVEILMGQVESVRKKGDMIDAVPALGNKYLYGVCTGLLPAVATGMSVAASYPIAAGAVSVAATGLIAGAYGGYKHKWRTLPEAQRRRFIPENEPTDMVYELFRVPAVKRGDEPEVHMRYYGPTKFDVQDEDGKQLDGRDAGLRMLDLAEQAGVDKVMIGTWQWCNISPGDTDADTDARVAFMNENAEQMEDYLNERGKHIYQKKPLKDFVISGTPAELREKLQASSEQENKKQLEALYNALEAVDPTHPVLTARNNAEIDRSLKYKLPIAAKQAMSRDNSSVIRNRVGKVQMANDAAIFSPDTETAMTSAGGGNYALSLDGRDVPDPKTTLTAVLIADTLSDETRRELKLPAEKESRIAFVNNRGEVVETQSLEELLNMTSEEIVAMLEHPELYNGEQASLDKDTFVKAVTVLIRQRLDSRIGNSTVPLKIHQEQSDEAVKTPRLFDKELIGKHLFKLDRSDDTDLSVMHPKNYRMLGKKGGAGLGALLITAALAYGAGSMAEHDYQGAVTEARVAVAAANHKNPKNVDPDSEIFKEAIRTYMDEHAGPLANTWGSLKDAEKALNKFILHSAPTHFSASSADNSPGVGNAEFIGPERVEWQIASHGLSAAGYWAAGTSSKLFEGSYMPGIGRSLSWSEDAETMTDELHLPTSLQLNAKSLEVSRTISDGEGKSTVKLPVLEGMVPVAASLDGKSVVIERHADNTYTVHNSSAQPGYKYSLDNGVLRYWLAPDPANHDVVVIEPFEFTSGGESTPAPRETYVGQIEKDWNAIIPGFSAMSASERASVVGSYLHKNYDYSRTPFPSDTSTESRPDTYNRQIINIDPRLLVCNSTATETAIATVVDEAHSNAKQDRSYGIATGYLNIGDADTLTNREAHMWNVDNDLRTPHIDNTPSASVETVTGVPNQPPEDPFPYLELFGGVVALGALGYQYRRGLLRGAKRTSLATQTGYNKAVQQYTVPRIVALERTLRAQPETLAVAAELSDAMQWSEDPDVAATLDRLRRFPTAKTPDEHIEKVLRPYVHGETARQALKPPLATRVLQKLPKSIQPKQTPQQAAATRSYQVLATASRMRKYMDVGTKAAERLAQLRKRRPSAVTKK